MALRRHGEPGEPDDARELLEAAEEIRKKTVDHFALTHYIRKNSGRRFVESRVLSDEGVPLTAFRFEAGQRCFRADEHRARLERPEIYLVRDGDWRGNPRGTEPRRHASAADWVDDFANHQETLANRLKEG